MVGSIVHTTNLVGLIILVNNVETQNNENTNVLTTGQASNEQEPPAMLHKPKQKIYDPKKIDALFNQHAPNIYGLNQADKTEVDQYYKVFKENIMMMNQLSKFYNTAQFSINAYTHLTLDEFTNWYTGFNSTGLTVEDVMLFNRTIVQHIPPVINWSDGILNDYYQETKCKNSYVLSALSKLF